MEGHAGSAGQGGECGLAALLFNMDVTTMSVPEGGGFPESSEGGREEEAGARAAAPPGGAGKAAEEEGTSDLTGRQSSTYLVEVEFVFVCLPRESRRS